MMSLSQVALNVFIYRRTTRYDRGYQEGSIFAYSGFGISTLSFGLIYRYIASYKVMLIRMVGDDSVYFFARYCVPLVFLF